MGFFSTNPLEIGVVIIVVALIDICASLFLYKNDYSTEVMWTTVALNVIMMILAFGVIKKVKIAYYLALIIVFIGFLGAIVAICCAAGVQIDGFGNVGWLTAICEFIVEFIILGCLISVRPQIVKK